MTDNTLSYWHKTGRNGYYKTLTDSIETDVLIIGGGITGVTCAYCLAQKGLKPVLIEAASICAGTTGNTTGKVTVQHGLIYGKIAEKYGMEAARDYAQSQGGALEFVKAAVENEQIDCQLQMNTAYVWAENSGEWDALEKEYALALKLGIDAELSADAGFPQPGVGLLGFRNQYVFHPVRYVNALAEAAARSGALIFGGTKAIKLENGDIKTVRCENTVAIRAGHVVMATQYPFYDGPNLFYMRLYPKRDYGVAVRAREGWPEGSYISAGDPVRSLRTHVENGQRILIAVGDAHDTGRGDEDMSQHYKNLLEFADRTAGVEEVLAMWSAQDYDTPDELPYIGRVSHDAAIYVATGYRKWGLSTGTLAGMMLTDLITHGSCRYEGLYSRTRADITSSPGKALAGAVIPIGQLIKSKFVRVEDIEGLEPGEGRVIRFQGEKAGIYRSVDDDVTILDITCTHMGTELKFNTAEKTWDCPAHGGRFGMDGRLLEGPPKDNLKVLFKGKYEDLPGDA